MNVHVPQKIWKIIFSTEQNIVKRRLIGHIVCPIFFAAQAYLTEDLRFFLLLKKTKRPQQITHYRVNSCLKLFIDWVFLCRAFVQRQMGKKLLKRIILSTFFGVLGSQNWNYHVHLNIRIFEHLHIWIFEISLFGVLNSQNWNCVNSELDLKSWVSLWFYDHHRKGDRFNVCSIRKDGSDFSILTPPSPPKKIPTNATNKKMQQTHQHYHVTRYQEDIIYLLKSRIWKQTFHLWIVIYTRGA